MDILEKIDQLAAERLSQICDAADDIVVKGSRYYVSAQGDDDADGLTPKTAWKTIQRVNSADFDAGDGVFFRRGDVFRGGIIAREGVTYAAYGEGPKPRLYGWQRDLADSALWTEEDTEKKSGWIALLILTRDILETCIDVLGFEAPDRM